MNIPEWLLQLFVGAILSLGGTVIAGFIWIIRLGSRVTALEKESVAVQTQMLDALKEANEGIAELNKALALAREQALLTFVPDDRFQRLEDKVDDIGEKVAGLGPAQPKTSRQRRRRASSASEE